jgi:hypothetical protein
MVEFVLLATDTKVVIFNPNVPVLIAAVQSQSFAKFIRQ